LVGVAVNVTEVPKHIAPEGVAEILTEGTTVGFTLIEVVEEYWSGQVL
jgi:hypothetical protein